MEEGHQHHQRDRVNDEDDEREEEEEERTGGRGRRTLNLFSFDRGGEEEKNEITAQNADLVNRVALVTGCTSGIGKQVVLDLALAGAKVVFGCRNLKKAGEVKREMMEKFPHLDLVLMEGVTLDVSSGESVSYTHLRAHET